jgi:hypothetical protein
MNGWEEQWNLEPFIRKIDWDHHPEKLQFSPSTHKTSPNMRASSSNIRTFDSDRRRQSPLPLTYRSSSSPASMGGIAAPRTTPSLGSTTSSSSSSGGSQDRFTTIDIICEVSRVGNCQRQLSGQFNKLLSEFADFREGVTALTDALRESHRGQGQDSSTVSQGNIKQKNVTSEEIGYYLPQSSQLRTGKMDLTKVRQARSAERRVFVGWCRSLSDNFLYEFKTGTVNRMAYDRQTNVLAGLVIEYITNKLQYQATDISIDEVRYLLKATCK